LSFRFNRFSLWHTFVRSIAHWLAFRVAVVSAFVVVVASASAAVVG
jgi:hypothetical protein